MEEKNKIKHYSSPQESADALKDAKSKAGMA